VCSSDLKYLRTEREKTHPDDLLHLLER